MDFISEKLYLYEVSFFKLGDTKRKIFYHPILIVSILFIILMRELTSLIFNDPALSLLIGDIVYNWRLKSMFNLTIIFGDLVSFNIMIIHFYHSFKNVYHFWPIETSSTLRRISTYDTKIKLVS